MVKSTLPIKIHVWATKHKGNDKWKVAIDDPGHGPLIELKTRYTRKHGGVKGGIRKLKRIGHGDKIPVLVFEKPGKR